MGLKYTKIIQISNDIRVKMPPPKYRPHYFELNGKHGFVHDTRMLAIQVDAPVNFGDLRFDEIRDVRDRYKQNKKPFASKMSRANRSL